MQDVDFQMLPLLLRCALKQNLLGIAFSDFVYKGYFHPCLISANYQVPYFLSSFDAKSLSFSFQSFHCDLENISAYLVNNHLFFARLLVKF